MSILSSVKNKLESAGTDSWMSALKPSSKKMSVTVIKHGGEDPLASMMDDEESDDGAATAKEVAAKKLIAAFENGDAKAVVSQLEKLFTFFDADDDASDDEE